MLAAVSLVRSASGGPADPYVSALSDLAVPRVLAYNCKNTFCVLHFPGPPTYACNVQANTSCLLSNGGNSCTTQECF